MKLHVWLHKLVYNVERYYYDFISIKKTCLTKILILMKIPRQDIDMFNFKHPRD